MSLWLSLSALFIVTSAFAGPREILFRNERVCDAERILCFHGSLTYESNPRLLHLRARVRTASGPGLLRIRVIGTNELGHRRRAPFEVRVRGQHSEIINHRMVPDHPDVNNWVVEHVEFISDHSP